MESVLKILGAVAAVLGAVILLPGLFSYLDGDKFVWIFLFTSLACIAVGLLLWIVYANAETELDHRSALLLVTLTWALAGVLGALPYYLSASTATFLDAVFESVSGFTGTGASVITDVESLDRGILLWRSLTQWLGGLGIIVFFVAVLPTLGFSGVQLFRAEVAGPQKDRLTPRVHETARKLWLLYVALTVLLFGLLTQAGMGWFDALNHGLTTLATGGFSTRNDGIAAFDNPALEWILGGFMLIAALNFTLLYRFLIGQEAKALKDSELGAFLCIVGVAFAALWSEFQLAGGQPAAEAAGNAFFTSASLASSTGWSAGGISFPFVQTILVLLLVMGGMSGSASGGIKCIRLLCAFKHLNRQLKKVVHPKAVIPVKVNGHIVPDSIIDDIWGLIFLYLLVFSVSVLVLSAEGLDLMASASASLAILSNSGPSLSYFAPEMSYAALSDVSKVVLIAGMLLGRLEFFTLLVIFTPTFWKR